jgi:hypothetical protein
MNPANSSVPHCPRLPTPGNVRRQCARCYGDARTYPARSCPLAILTANRAPRLAAKLARKGGAR